MKVARRSAGPVLRVYPAESGGAIGGRTAIHVESVCAMPAKKSGDPVRLVMRREDVLRATGPTSGSSMAVTIWVKRDGTIAAADGLSELQAATGVAAVSCTPARSDCPEH